MFLVKFTLLFWYCERGVEDSYRTNNIFNIAVFWNLHIIRQTPLKVKPFLIRHNRYCHIHKKGSMKELISVHHKPVLTHTLGLALWTEISSLPKWTKHCKLFTIINNGEQPLPQSVCHKMQLQRIFYITITFTTQVFTTYTCLYWWVCSK